MKFITFEQLETIFSKARLTPYLKNHTSSKLVLEKYHANIALSEAMLPTLHYLELCLRNSIDKVICKHYGSNWLITFPKQLLISEQDILKVKQIVSRVKQQNKREPTHDDIVAQMTFGFWCSFFHRKYDPILWQRKNALKAIFPNLLRINRKRSFIEQNILEIKSLRNRIAHHEPKVTINESHKMCINFISAMSLDAVEMLQMLDRFPEVYKKVFHLFKPITS